MIRDLQELVWKGHIGKYKLIKNQFTEHQKYFILKSGMKTNDKSIQWPGFWCVFVSLFWKFLSVVMGLENWRCVVLP